MSETPNRRAILKLMGATGIGFAFLFVLACSGSRSYGTTSLRPGRDLRGIYDRAATSNDATRNPIIVIRRNRHLVIISSLEIRLTPTNDGKFLQTGPRCATAQIGLTASRPRRSASERRVGLHHYTRLRAQQR
jgi:hypothetical protein